MDDLTFEQYGWLVEGYNDKLKNETELMAYAVQVGYLRANTKKKIVMWDDEKPKVQKITREQKDREINYLKTKFEGVNS